MILDGKLSFDYEDIDEKEPKRDLNFKAAAFTAIPPPINSNIQDYETPVPILSTVREYNIYYNIYTI